MKKYFVILLPLFSLSILSLPIPAFAEAGWNNGFYIKSDDGQFQMNLGGKLQVQEEIEKRVATEPTAPGRAAQRPNNFSDTFRIRRATIKSSGTLFGKWDWLTFVQTGTQAGNATNFDNVWGAILTYRIHNSFVLSGGTVNAPMDRMGEGSSSWLLGVEPPLTATQRDGHKALTISRSSFGLSPDLGLRVDGDVGKRFSYAVGLVNGNGDQTANLNNELTYGVRGQVHILDKADYSEPDLAWSEKPKLSIGFGTAFEDEDAADIFIANVTRQWSWTASGDVGFRYRGFSLNSELYHRVLKVNRNNSPEDTNRDGKLRDVGYYANAGYFVIPKKLEWMLTASQIFREGADNNSNEFGGGVNWYIKENNVKLQMDYTNVLDYDAVPGLNNATYHRVRMMFSVIF